MDGAPHTTPAVEPDRLSAAVAALAAAAAQPEVRTQLHALSGILANLVPQPVDEAERTRLEAELSGALDAGDEPAVVGAMRRLAALDRARIRPVDFSLASRG